MKRYGDFLSQEPGQAGMKGNPICFVQTIGISLHIGSAKPQPPRYWAGMPAGRAWPGPHERKSLLFSKEIWISFFVTVILSIIAYKKLINPDLDM